MQQSVPNRGIKRSRIVKNTNFLFNFLLIHRINSIFDLFTDMIVNTTFGTKHIFMFIILFISFHYFTNINSLHFKEIYDKRKKKRKNEGKNHSEKVIQI